MSGQDFLWMFSEIAAELSCLESGVEKMERKFDLMMFLTGISRLLFIALLSFFFSMAGRSICSATTVNLEWGNNSGATGYKVYYQADSASQPFTGSGAIEGPSPVDIQGQTNATISGLDPSHSYSFAVTAYNDSGESTYSNVVSVPELVEPTVTISSPADNSNLNGIVSVTTAASDNVGVTKVEFYINGTLRATDTSTPYIYSWDTSSLTAGSYTLMSKAYDAAGNIGQDSITVNVGNDTSPPTVTINSPANISTVSGIVTISASANDDVGITNVEFYENGNLLTATNVTPYSYNWNTQAFVNGEYTLSAKAYDATGKVGQSDVTITVSNISITVPAAPTIGTATAGNTQASVSFTAPASNGGSPITGYTVTSSAGQTATGTASPITVTGLTNGTSYTFTVKATNAVGTGAASAASNSVIPATMPGAPTIGTTTAGNTQATVTFTAPASNGGSPITSYTVTSSAGQTATGTASPITVTGLTNGTAYTFTVKATNAVGTGAASAASNSVTPYALPTVSIIAPATGTKVKGTITVTASASDNIGISAVNFFVDGIFYKGAATSSPYSISWDTTVVSDGSHTIYAIAYNAAGNGKQSSTISVTVDNTVTAPSAPTMGSAYGGNAQATVSFTAPASDGGSPITGYTVTSSAGQTATGTASPITVSGLTNGTAYTFTVKATNAVGTGVASAASNSVTPATVPGVPTSVSAIAGNALASVSFTAPASNGGSPITGYTVTSSAGQTATGTASPIKVTGLTNGTAYTFTVKATNTVGSSAASAASNSVTPVAAPSTPPVVSIVTPMNGAKYAAPASIILTAAATASNATITKVEFYNGSTLLKSLTSAPYTFTWSINSKGTYSITAKAYDSNGKSNVSSPVSFTVYSKVTGVTFSSISQASPSPIGTSVTFKASASGGSGSYQYQFLVKSPVTGWATTQAYSTNCSFLWTTSGLPTGTYYIQVMARNTGSTAAYEASKSIKYVLK
jgi:hypothetical protein